MVLVCTSRGKCGRLLCGEKELITFEMEKLVLNTMETILSSTKIYLLE